MANSGFKVMDSDMHIMEPPDMWARYIDEEFRSIAPQGLTSENVRMLGVAFPGEVNPNPTTPPPHRGRNYERNQLLYAEHSKRGWIPDCQLDAMDREGLDVAVLFPSRGLSVLVRPDREPRFAAAIARAYNDWLADFCAHQPERLLGAGMISVFDIKDAISESERVIRDLGFRAVFVRANVVNGKNWHDPYYEPLWEALEELGVPVGFHEAFGGGVEMAGAKYEPEFGMRRIYGQPMENMLAMASFLCGGILERHPGLRVAWLEANCSWAPWLLWRMDECYELEGDLSMPELSMAPSDYFRRQCFLSVEPDEATASHMVADYGAEQLVFSTDYPHGDSRYPEAVDTFLELPLSEGEKHQILWDNCARLYGLS